MNVGLIGLGRMGQAIAARLVHAGFGVIGYDKYMPEVIDLKLNTSVSPTPGGFFEAAQTVSECAQKTSVLWLMIPQGKPVDDVIHELMPHLKEGSIIIDGGNSFYRDSVRRYTDLKKRSINYLDCGTSGGLHGREIGFSLMVGGDTGVYDQCKNVFAAAATADGYRHVGPSGAGHYVKMVHNGIEYGLLEAYAEGFHILKEGSYKDLDLAVVSDLWNHGSIIRSWILTLAYNVFTRDQNFTHMSGAIGENLTGLWTTEEAERNSIPVDVIKAALKVRADSRRTGGNYATKLVALLRHEFGGHPIEVITEKKDKKE